MPDNLGNSGYYIVANGKSIFIMGETEFGLRNGVYAFLYYTIGMETFAADTVVYNCGNTVQFPYSMEVVGRADIDMILPSNRLDDEKTVHAMGMLTKSDVFALTEDKTYTDHTNLVMHGNYWHNSFNYISPETYLSEHPSWYATSENGAPSQICYTAHGNSSEYGAMVDTVYAKMKDYLNKSPNATTITFTIQDNEEICHCDRCTELFNKYQSNSAAVIMFINDIADKLKADYPHVRLLFFAYNRTEQAPNKVDEYTKCRDNVAVFYAPIQAIYNASFSDPSNAATAEQIQKWAQFSENLYLWLYNTNFNYYLFPHNSFEAMAEINNFCVQYNVKFIYWEGQWDQIGATAFSTLKEYMNAKLAWNSGYTAEELYDRFFPAYFGAASGTMRTYFDELIAHLKANTLSGKLTGKIDEAIASADIWDKATLEKWLGNITAAYSEVEEGSVYYRHIKLESIFIRHALTAFYGVEDSAFKADCAELGVERYSECGHDQYGYSCGNLQGVGNGINWKN